MLRCTPDNTHKCNHCTRTAVYTNFGGASRNLISDWLGHRMMWGRPRCSDEQVFLDVIY